jgi:hypothetical protein
VGLLADFFVSTPEDALQYGALIQHRKSVPPDRFQLASYKNFTPLALEMLWAILLDEQWSVRRHSLEHVFHAEGEESWLFRFPDELVQHLANLKEADLHQVADAWADPREVPGNSDQLLPVLQDLQQLSIQAQTNAKNLYFWGSR